MKLIETQIHFREVKYLNLYKSKIAERNSNFINFLVFYAILIKHLTNFSKFSISTETEFWYSIISFYTFNISETLFRNSNWY